MRTERRLGISAFVAALALLAFAVAAGSVSAATIAPPVVSNGWIRLPAVPGRPAAAYATIKGGGAPDRLIAIEGPPPSRLELHTSRMASGVMRMRRIGAVPVAAGATVTMQAGGMHVMIFGLPNTKADTRVPLTFVFEKAGRISVSAHAMAANADAGMHHR